MDLKKGEKRQSGQENRRPKRIAYPKGNGRGGCPKKMKSFARKKNEGNQNGKRSCGSFGGRKVRQNRIPWGVGKNEAALTVGHLCHRKTQSIVGKGAAINEAQRDA